MLKVYLYVEKIIDTCNTKICNFTCLFSIELKLCGLYVDIEKNLNALIKTLKSSENLNYHRCWIESASHNKFISNINFIEIELQFQMQTLFKDKFSQNEHLNVEKMVDTWNLKIFSLI